MNFLFSFIAFSSVFAQSLSQNANKSVETNDLDNNPLLIEEVVIEGIDANALNSINNILFNQIKSQQNKEQLNNDLDKQLNDIFVNYTKAQHQFNQQFSTLIKSDGFNEMMIDRSMPLSKVVFKYIWDKFICILDSIWSSVNHINEKIFNRSLPLTYYKSTKTLAKQFASFLCQQAFTNGFSVSIEKAVHHCSAIFSSLKI